MSTTFSIEPVRRNVFEVLMHGVRYVYESKRGYGKLEASRKRGVLERAELVSKGNETSISMWHQGESALTFTSRVTRDQVSTSVRLGEWTYDIRSDRRSHGIELARVLRGKKGPRMRYIRWFGKEFANNAQFRQALTDQGVTISNGEQGTVCGFACTCCLILLPDPVPFDEAPCCAVCSACFLDP